MKPIVTLTLNPTIDGASDADVVQPIRKVRTTNERYLPGGGGINVARVIGELGGQAVTTYMAGGATGTVFDELARECGLDARRIPIAGHTRIAYTVFEHSTGQEYRFVPEGPEIGEPEWQDCLRLLQDTQCDYFVASGSVPRGIPADFYIRAGEIVRRNGAKFVLDTSGPALKTTLEAGGVYFAKPSRGEFEQLVGRDLPDEESLHEAARRFFDDTAVELLAITLGRDGAILVDRTGIRRFAPLPVQARSAVGAGDSFVAAMTLGLARGMPPIEAFRYGMAAGTAAVLTPGNDLCKRADVERLFAELQAREG
jgi:6-phosphofructokinase 2